MLNVVKWLNDMKICTKCKEYKPLTEFCKRSISKDGLALVCRECAVDFKKKYYSDPRNIERDRERKKKWRVDNVEKKRVANKKWVKNNLEKNREYQRIWARKYRITHKRDQSLDSERKREWAKNNAEKVRISNNKSNVKLRSTLKGRLNGTIASTVGSSLRRKGGKKNGYRWEILVGYTVFDLKAHLEKQFENGMTWDNYGSYWEIDHKIPVSAFNFTSPGDIDFKKCWSLGNLQPLWAKENQSKNDRLDKPFQPSLALSIAE
jgi:hypothetical protein